GVVVTAETDAPPPCAEESRPGSRAGRCPTMTVGPALRRNAGRADTLAAGRRVESRALRRGAMIAVAEATPVARAAADTGPPRCGFAGAGPPEAAGAGGLSHCGLDGSELNHPRAPGCRPLDGSELSHPRMPGCRPLD